MWVSQVVEQSSTALVRLVQLYARQFIVSRMQMMFPTFLSSLTTHVVLHSAQRWATLHDESPV